MWEFAEHINNEICGKCEDHNCCLPYRWRNPVPLELKLGAHKWKTNDWYNESMEKYKVYPLYDSQLNIDNPACEFLGPNGCIIERNLRPLACRAYFCEKFPEHKDYKSGK